MRSMLCRTLALLLAALPAGAVPLQLNYQGRVAVNGTNFDGSGQFKFALVNANGSLTYWSNDNSSVAGSAPATAVTLPVAKGLYAVLLGDTALTNMQAVPASVFDQPDVRLRVWFNDGTTGFQLLTPDQRLASSGYAMRAANVEDAAITSAKLASGAVGTAQLAAGSVGSAQLAAGAVAAPLSAGTSVTATANTAYHANNSGLSTFTLPATANPGDIVTVNGTGSGGWALTGNSWIRREQFRNWRGLAMSSDGRKLVGVVNNGFIYTSTDFGVSFQPRDTSRPWRSVSAHTDGTRLVAAAYSGSTPGVFLSFDSGVTWQYSGIPGSAGYHNAVALGGGFIVATADGNGTAGNYLYVSADAGTTWVQRVADAPRFWSAAAVGTNGPTLYAVDRGAPASAGGQIWVSNGTNNWTARETNRRWSGIASSTNGTKAVAVVNGGQIYTSTDSGVTWTPRETDRAWTAVVSSTDGTRLAATVDGGQIYVSTDSGVTWTPQESNRSWNALASSGSGLNLAASVNGGQIWTFGPFLSGGINSFASVQYQGSGVWAPMAQASLATGSVTSAQLAPDSVTTEAIASRSIGANAIIPGVIGPAQLAVGAVGTAQLAAGAVGAAQLAAGAVGTSQLADGAVGPSQLAAGAVGTAQIADGSVTTQKLALTDLTLSRHLTVDNDTNNGGEAVFPGLSFGAVGSGEGIASKRDAGIGQNGLRFFTANLPRISILNTGNVGIGTTNPTLAKLQIVGFGNAALSYGYLNSSGTTGTSSGPAVALSIHASDRIACSEFNAFSDARIKTIAGPTDNAADLRTLRQIQVTDYTFRDRIGKGTTPQKKVIAQQVEEVFPQAVGRLTDVIPDIYRAAEMRGGWIELATDLRVGERVRLIADQEQGVYDVLEVRPGAFRSSFPAAALAKIFVFGREVHDFRSVDYDAVSMLHVSATQELARRLEAKEAEVATLRRRLAEHEAADQEREARLARLERLLAPTVAQIAAPRRKAAAQPAR